MLLEILKVLYEAISSLWSDRRTLRVLVHRGVLLEGPHTHIVYKGDFKAGKSTVALSYPSELQKGPEVQALGGREKTASGLIKRPLEARSPVECFFVNVVNLSRDRELEITHVWFDCNPQIEVFQPARPLPRRLKPDESWETWINVSAMPKKFRDSEQVYRLAKVRLSNGKIYKSARNVTVPDTGLVPGGN